MKWLAVIEEPIAPAIGSAALLPAILDEVFKEEL
jgi:hypothetical protein